MIVSFVIVAHNEEEYIKGLFEDLCAQSYAHSNIEILLIDSASTDTTKQKMLDFAEQHKDDFAGVKVLDNPKRILPAGWNVAIEAASGEVMLRVDAHSRIPEDFIQRNVECLESGEDVCGGYRPNVIDGDSPWKQTLLMAESSMFGSSFASYRRNTGKHYVDSIFHGAYRKSVFDKVGPYNESLARTEDNEMHYRIREAGYKILFDPDIRSYQHTRPTLKGMLRQKFLNGLWVAKTLFVCPKCLSLFYFVPAAFICGILATSLLSCFGIWQLGALMWGAYWLLAILMSIAAFAQNKKVKFFALLMPILFFLLHISYGAGSFAGFFSVIFKKKK